ncbi:MAG: TonB-dependent receptor, partial [Muribaculaceae bacterium]|nr:TonB-dependent receptor [Muribaculaceae bacterium]
PEPYALADGRPAWSRTFNTYAQLNAQVTRNFRHWAVYIGGENLTNFRQPDPIKGASDPWGPDFDATMVYGPLQGAMVYVGFRYNITKYL